MQTLHSYPSDRIFDKLCQKIRCPECGVKMTFYPLKKRTGFFVCIKCKNINLVENNIFVFLPQKYETNPPYRKFISKYGAFINNKYHYAAKFITKKIDSLPAKRLLVWEDEDVIFWNKKYRQDARKIEIKTYKSKIKGLRLLTREKNLFSYLRNTAYENKFLLEIGCGESSTVGNLFSPLNYKYNLIASDYSYWALRYTQKIFKNADNTFYFQCPGNTLPFKRGSLDYILSLGVLHHMPQKELHLLEIVSKLKSHGMLICNEAYQRKANFPFVISNMIEKFIEPDKSHHEERINWDKAKKILRSKGKIVHQEHEYSPTRTVLVRLFNSAFERLTLAAKICILLDKLTINTLGKIWGVFGPGSVLFIFENK